MAIARLQQIVSTAATGRARFTSAMRSTGFVFTVCSTSLLVGVLARRGTPRFSSTQQQAGRSTPVTTRLVDAPRRSVGLGRRTLLEERAEALLSLVACSPVCDPARGLRARWPLADQPLRPPHGE